MRTGFLKRKDGQVALSLVFLIGGVVVLIGATMVFLIYSFLLSSAGFQASNRALVIALAGANDALVQLSRNRIFPAINPGGLGLNCSSYNFDIGGDQATVLVVQEENLNCVDWQGVSFVPATNQVYIDSEATISERRRLVRVVVSVDRSTGEIRIISLRQESGTSP